MRAGARKQRRNGTLAGCWITTTGHNEVVAAFLATRRYVWRSSISLVLSPPISPLPYQIRSVSSSRKKWHYADGLAHSHRLILMSCVFAPKCLTLCLIKLPASKCRIYLISLKLAIWNYSAFGNELLHFIPSDILQKICPPSTLPSSLSTPPLSHPFLGVSANDITYL